MNQTDPTAALRDRIADAIRAAACPGDCGKTEEDCAKERIQPFVWHHGKLAGVEGSPEQFADAVLAVLPEPVAEFELRGTAEIRAAALIEAADELGRMDYDTDSNDYGYDTYRDAWNGGVMDGAALLRRLAVEAHGTGTQQPARCPHGCDVTRCPCLACEADDTEAGPDRCSGCRYVPCGNCTAPVAQPAAKAPDRRVTVEYFVQGQQPDGTWEDASSMSMDRGFATDRLTARRQRRPDCTFRLAERTTTVVVQPLVDDVPAPVAQQPAAEAWVCKCPAGLCGCGHHAPAEQQAAAADGEETPFVPPAHYVRDDGVECCVHTTPVGPDSCRACRELADD